MTKDNNVWIITTAIIVLLILLGSFGMMGFGGGMMGYYGLGMGLFGSIFMILVTIILVLSIFWIVKQIQESNKR